MEMDLGRGSLEACAGTRCVSTSHAMQQLQPGGWLSTRFHWMFLNTPRILPESAGKPQLMQQLLSTFRGVSENLRSRSVAICYDCYVGFWS